MSRCRPRRSPGPADTSSPSDFVRDMSAQHPLLPLLRKRSAELVGAVPATLVVADHLAAHALIGVTVHEDLDKPQAGTAMSVPDMPVDQSGVSPEGPAA